MCTSEAKATANVEAAPPASVAKLNGRPVLQPSACNRVPSLDRLNSLKKSSSGKTLSSLPPPRPGQKTTSLTPPISPKPSPPEVMMRGGNGSDVSSVPMRSLDRKKSKSFKLMTESPPMGYSPGSIAAVRREQVALEQAQRKMRIAHYGRSKSAKFEAKVVPLDAENDGEVNAEEAVKRCSFITANSDPIYVAYHDEEWGVPVHDDRMLFELLVLSGAQVGSDWASILKRRQDFRIAFSGFDAETVASFTDKQMNSISSDYGINISQVRAVIDNSKIILQIRKEFGSFERYVWGFVNHKPISTNYKFGYRIPVKTSKSEMISKDMVRRGFRYVGPTVVHSFMQAAGLTNDHLISCHRHLPCSLMAAKKAFDSPPRC